MNSSPGLAQRVTRIRWLVFALACGTSFLLYLHRYTWNIIQPALIDDFHLTKTEVGFLFSLFYYTYACGQIPSGVVIDRFGARRLLSTIILLWSLSLGAFGMTKNLLLLKLARLVFGAAQAGCYPALTKITHSWFPLSQRTSVQGWVATTFGRGGAAASPILMATLLMSAGGLSWQRSLLVLAGIGLCCGVLFFALFRDSPFDDPRVSPGELDLIQEGRAGSQASVGGYLSAPRALRSTPLRLFVLQQYLDAGSDVAFVSLIGSFFEEVHHVKLSTMGLLASLPLLGGALGGIAGGFLNDHLIAVTGNRRWTRSGVGFVGKAIGCAMLTAVLWQSQPIYAAFLLMAAKFFGDWSQPTTWGACTDLGGRFSATVFGIINTAGTLGGIVMPVVFGLILDHFTSESIVSGETIRTTDWNPLFFLLATMYFGSGVCWLLVNCTQTLTDE